MGALKFRAESGFLRKSSDRLRATATETTFQIIDNSTLALTSSASVSFGFISSTHAQDEVDGRIAVSRRSEPNGPSLDEVLKKYGL